MTQWWAPVGLAQRWAPAELAATQLLSFNLQMLLSCRFAVTQLQAACNTIKF